MALINCPECGNSISDKAKACIHCGFPIEDMILENQTEETLPEVEYDENDNIRIDYHESSYLEIKNGYLTIYSPIIGEVTDLIDNFVLDYHAVIMGNSVGFSIYNLNKVYFTGILDVNYRKDLIDKFEKFKSIMIKHNCFLGRKRFDAIYRLPKDINKIKEAFFEAKREEYKKNQSRKCPKCGSKRFHAFIEDKEVIKGKTKASYSANLNPLKPFTFANKTEKVVRDPITIQKSKFLCDDCGHIFD